MTYNGRSKRNSSSSVILMEVLIPFPGISSLGDRCFSSPFQPGWGPPSMHGDQTVLCAERRPWTFIISAVLGKYFIMFLYTISSSAWDSSGPPLTDTSHQHYFEDFFMDFGLPRLPCSLAPCPDSLWSACSNVKKQKWTQIQK